MIALKVEDVKTFTSKLFLKEDFDSFLVKEVNIVTYNNFSVSEGGSSRTIWKLPGSFFPFISEKHTGRSTFQEEKNSIWFSSSSSSV